MSVAIKNLPFERGTTLQFGETTIDATLGVNLEGAEYEVEDFDPTTGAQRTGRPVTLRVVRNVSAGALLPKRAVNFQASAGLYGSRVDGYARLTAQDTASVDEYLPSSGAPVNDLFYVVVKGPRVVLTDLAGGANNLIAVGDILVSLTAATSGATTAGRVGPQDATGATLLLANQIQNAIGRALTARTTGNTNADLLIDSW